MTPDVQREISIAVLGASVGLAGLSLVFLGFSLQTYSSYPSDTGDKILRPYRYGAWVMAFGFAIGLLAALFSLLWLLGGNKFLYCASIVFFVCQMALSIGAGAGITSLVLRGKLWL